MLDKNGNEITDLNVNISPRSANQQADRLALNKGKDTTTFKSESDMNEKAEKIFTAEQKRIAAEIEADKEKGFDITDIKSIENFDIGYCPYGQSIIIKNVHEQENIKGLILPDVSSGGKKAVVVSPGLYCPTLRVGDIIVLRPVDNTGKIHIIERTFKGVKFNEVETVFIAGVFQNIATLNNRVEEDAKRYNQLKNM